MPKFVMDSQQIRMNRTGDAISSGAISSSTVTSMTAIDTHLVSPACK